MSFPSPSKKYVTFDFEHPQAVGVCDYSGFFFNHKDLHKQMEWRGNSLVWNGFLVGKPYLDIPNEQMRNPLIYPDPVPIKDPRPPQGPWAQTPGVFNPNAQQQLENTNFMQP
jgi:hypothetical protein